MFIQKVISKVLNIKNSSRVFGLVFLCLVGCSIENCQYLDFFKFDKIVRADSSVDSVHSDPPWPE